MPKTAQENFETSPQDRPSRAVLQSGSIAQDPLEAAISLVKLPKKDAYFLAKETFNGSTVDLKLKVETNLSRCRLLWERFSPHKSLFDTWNFRYAWWLGYHNPPYFMTILFKDEPVACLPLWYEDYNKEFRWFGSWWQEDNTFFSLHESLVPVMLKILPRPTLLNAISCFPEVANKYKFSLDDPKYILHLKGLNSADDFLTRFRKKRRYNLKRDRRKILQQKPKTVFNRFGDLKHLVRLSMERFHALGDDSDWEDPDRVKTFEAVISHAKEYEPRMITTEINGKIAGVDLVAIYKNTYYLLKCGYNIADFPGVGNYTNLLQINDAISLGMEKMDFLEIGYGWKEKLLEEVPLYQYRAQ